MKLTHIQILDKSIELIYDGNEVFLPIKPICELLNVNYTTQAEKLKTDENFISTAPLRGTVAADGKQREMLCLPIMYIPAWLFTIQPANVKPEAREKLIGFRGRCIQALGDYFITRVIMIHENLDLIENAETELKEVEKEIKESDIFKRKAELQTKIREAEKSVDDILAGRGQLKLF